MLPNEFPLIRYGVRFNITFSPSNLQWVVCEIGLFGRFQAVEVVVERIETKIPHVRGGDTLNDTIVRGRRRATAAAVHVRRRLVMVVEFLFFGVCSATSGRHIFNSGRREIAKSNFFFFLHLPTSTTI